MTELIVGLCKRESNQPRPGVAPGYPQPMLRAQPCVCGAERVRGGDADMRKCFCTGKSRPLQNDGLEIGSYQTRPARRSSKHKVTVRGIGSRLCETHVRAHAAAACTQAGQRPPAASSTGRGRPRVRQEHQILFGTMHVAKSAHTRVDQAYVRERAGAGAQTDKGCTINKVGV